MKKFFNSKFFTRQQEHEFRMAALPYRQRIILHFLWFAFVTLWLYLGFDPFQVIEALKILTHLKF